MGLDQLARPPYAPTVDHNAESRRTFVNALMALGDLFETVESDLNARSIFSRSIAIRRFKSETGRSVEQWHHLLQSLVALSTTDVTLPVLERWPQLRLSLARLTDYFRRHSLSDAVERYDPVRLVTRVIIALEEME